MKRFAVILIIGLLALVVSQYCRVPSEQDSAAPAANALAKISSRARPQASVKLPTLTVRTPASRDPDPVLTQNFLDLVWQLVPSDERSHYTAKAIEVSADGEVYQLYYKNLEIQSLVVRRKAQRPSQVEPLPAFAAADDHDLVSPSDGEQSVRKSEPNVETARATGRLWFVGLNQKLIPAYTYAVTIKDTFEAQTWTIDARNGNVLSVNPHSRR